MSMETDQVKASIMAHVPSPLSSLCYPITQTTPCRLPSFPPPPSPQPRHPASLLPTALTRAQMWLDSRVCDQREKLPCQGVTKVSPM